MVLDIRLATRNVHKAVEISETFSDLGVHVASAEVLIEVNETGVTFRDNARLKALAILACNGNVSGMIADDSGLCVDALNGEPGVYSARYAGELGDGVTAANNAKLLESLGGVRDADRGAYFETALCFATYDKQLISAIKGLDMSRYLNAERFLLPDIALIEVSGRAYGRILMQPRGSGGFGYDPLFLSDVLGKTFAEASSKEKQRVSHRGNAIRALRPVLADIVSAMRR